MKLTHKRIQVIIRRNLFKYFWKVLPSAIMFLMFAGYLIRMNSDNAVNVQANTDRVDIILRYLQERRADAEANKELEEKRKLDKVLNQLEKQGEL